MGIEDDALGVAFAVADAQPVGVSAADPATLATRPGTSRGSAAHHFPVG